jgi:hypothetical protein
MLKFFLGLNKTTYNDYMSMYLTQYLYDKGLIHLLNVEEIFFSIAAFTEKFYPNGKKQYLGLLGKKV